MQNGRTAADARSTPACGRMHIPGKFRYNCQCNGNENPLNNTNPANNANNISCGYH